MSDLLEGSIDDILTVPADDERPNATPVILVEYRYRGVSTALAAMVLVLIAALAITSHRRLTRPHALGRQHPVGQDRSRVQPDTGPPVVGSPQPAPMPTQAPEVPPPNPEPVALATTAAVPPPTPDGAETPRDDVAPAPTPEFALAERAPAPPPDPRPTAEEVERAILREAEERKAELEAMDELKPEVRHIREAERPQRALEERVAFRKELLAIVRSDADDAGRRIADLCDQYGTEPADEQRRKVRWHLRHRSEQASLQDRVKLFRAFDVPEPAILEELARYWTLRLGNARNGLRDPDAVRVRAAKHLLSMPLAQQRSAVQH